MRRIPVPPGRSVTRCRRRAARRLGRSQRRAGRDQRAEPGYVMPTAWPAAAVAQSLHRSSSALRETHDRRRLLRAPSRIAVEPPLRAVPARRWSCTAGWRLRAGRDDVEWMNSPEHRAVLLSSSTAGSGGDRRAADIGSQTGDHLGGPRRARLSSRLGGELRQSSASERFSPSSRAPKARVTRSECSGKRPRPARGRCGQVHHHGAAVGRIAPAPHEAARPRA